MCVQWIFDRGAWNMTATNKAFAYVFNSPAEDQKVARVLSGRDPDQVVPLLSLSVFDSDTQTKIRTVGLALFNASYGLKTAQYNVKGRVLDTLITYLLRHYPSLKQLKVGGLAVECLEACAIEKGHPINELLAWSSHLACYTSTTPQADSTKSQDNTSDITKHPMFLHQAALIEQLIQINHKLDARLSTMEARVYNKAKQTPDTNEIGEDTSIEPPAKRRRTAAATNLKDVWFSWYAREPRIWSSTDGATKHTRSKAKLVAAFLELFLSDGFMLDEKSPQYRDDLLDLGATAEKKLLLFLGKHKITARGSQNVLKSMRKLHKAGHLNAPIQHYKQLQAAGRIGDPAPVHTTNILALISAA